MDKNFSLSSLSRFFRLHRSGFGLLALGVGVITGIVCVLFRYLIAGWTWVTTGYGVYDVHTGSPNAHFPQIGYWFIILVPIVSGLIYGPMIQKWAPSARGHGIPEVMLAVRRKGGQIPGAVAVVKLLASALTLGGGGSAGREGPVVQIGAALGSWWARIIRLDSNRVKMLVACGSAAGIAATFNSPLAGAVFALEVILATFTGEAFGMMVIASVGAAVVAHSLIGDELLVQLPQDLILSSDIDYGWVVLVGVLGGFVGIGFSKMLYTIEDIMSWIYQKTGLPEWLRPATFGGILGIMLMFLPEMFGNGAALQNQILTGKFSVVVLLLFLLARGFFTSFTMGMGGSGGVFAPSLFIGATLGCVIGQSVEGIAYSSAATFGVIGMGAVFAGAARAPITAVLIIMEMSGQYALVMPIMVAVTLATGVSRFLTRKTIYTEKLLRRGDVLDDPVAGTLLGRTRASEIMDPIPGELHADDTIREAAKMLRISQQNSLPVVASVEDRSFLGSLSALRVAQIQSDGVDPNTYISQLPLDNAYCTPSDLPSTVISTLLDSKVPGIPVVGNGKLEGWISQEGLVSRIYRQQNRALDSANRESSFGSRWQASHKPLKKFPWQNQ